MPIKNKNKNEYYLETASTGNILKYLHHISENVDKILKEEPDLWNYIKDVVYPILHDRFGVNFNFDRDSYSEDIRTVYRIYKKSIDFCEVISYTYENFMKEQNFKTRNSKT